jgi:CheY-like chemotaxis protein
MANHRTETALAQAGELAQSADRGTSRFLANISHEIRTPLNGILGLSGLLLEDALKPSQREKLLGVHSSAHDLLGLVNDLLDISRIEAGGVTVRIRRAEAAVPADPRSEALLFEVEDTGIGIPDAAQTGIFQPFTQGDTSASRRHEGAGLGLFISRQIVERMGGTIGFTSRQGLGTVFRFSLTLPRAEAPAVEVREAPGGLEALEKLGTRDYRLIFTDLHMPGMDGFEFTRKVRASAVSATALVVGVTADAMADSRARCLRIPSPPPGRARRKNHPRRKKTPYWPRVMCWTRTPGCAARTPDSGTGPWPSSGWTL